MKTKLKPTRMPNPNTRKKAVLVRVNDSEHAHLERAAMLYTGGNISEWVRYAALAHQPAKKDFQK